jgi:aspartyl-tRNA(Asn)/glutamyl-tRNA(Gln) amidotransferase subunit A
VLLGKTNLHEFAYGGTGDVSHFGPSRNPRNTDHMTGGSSSGSAAAVAGGVCPIALGTDTAGSIRIPAALCGIVGLKATYGLVPTADVIPLSWSQDHVGPLAATVEDAALALSAMADFEMPDVAAGMGRRPRVGVVREHFFASLDGDVRRVVEAALERLGDIREIQIPHIGFATAGQSLITGAEAAAFHRKWLDTRPGDYNWGVRNRIEAARGVNAVDYVQAMRLRGLLVEEMSAALSEVDVLAMPTEPIPAPELFQREVQLEDGAGDAISLLIRNTGPINYTGFPAITVPCGETPAGLPVGLQLVALPWHEAHLLRVAYAFEQLGK